MSTRKIAGIALLAGALAAGRVMAEDLWIHVQVNEGKGDTAVEINLPLSALEKMDGFIPREARESGRIRYNDRDYEVSDLRSLWDELQRSPDATLIRVKEKDSRVHIEKRGDYLHVHALETGAGREEVEIKMPLDVVSALLSGSGDELNIGAALRALARRGEGELMTVNGTNETVRIWVDDRAK
ncbi:MAG TPA: hypothetical protein VE685_24180 [Thermoanaerobaculia bacterium]|nr:hypothetical protein [Thermoanaerobaculia bacterium]